MRFRESLGYEPLGYAYDISPSTEEASVSVFHASDILHAGVLQSTMILEPESIPYYSLRCTMTIFNHRGSELRAVGGRHILPLSTQ